MSFIKTFQSIFCDTLINNMYNPDVQEACEEFVDVIFNENSPRKNYTFKEMMEWISKNMREFPRADSTFIKLEELSNKNKRIIICLIDKNKETLTIDGVPIGLDILTEKIDQDLNHLFKDTNTLVFN